MRIVYNNVSGCFVLCITPAKSTDNMYSHNITGTTYS